jgi:hypothetical protein
MRQALIELGAVLPPSPAGPEDLVVYWGSRVAAGTVDPVDGARWMLRQAEAHGWPDWLNRLTGLVSEWDDWPAGRDEIEQEMVAEALALTRESR